MHCRQQLREHVAVDTLAPIKALTGAGVIYKSRRLPKKAFPVVGVYTGAERYEVENPGYITGTNPKIYRRWLQLIVEIVVQTNTAPDDALDALIVHVERLLGVDDSQGDAVIATDLIATNITSGGEAEKVTEIATLTYEIEYRTTADNPEEFLK